MTGGKRTPLSPYAGAAGPLSGDERRHAYCHSSRSSSGSTPIAPDSLRTVEGWKPSLRAFFSKRKIGIGLICALWASSRCEKPRPMRNRLSFLPSRYVIDSIIYDCPPILLTSCYEDRCLNHSNFLVFEYKIVAKTIQNCYHGAVTRRELRG